MLDELTSKQKFTLNGAVKSCRRKKLSKMQVTCSSLAVKLCCVVVLMPMHQKPVRFLGRRDWTKEDVNMLVYKDEIEVCSVYTTRYKLVGLNVQPPTSHLQGWMKEYERVSRGSVIIRKKPTFREAAKKAINKVGESMLSLLLD